MYLIPSFGGLTISTLPWKFLFSLIIPTMRKGSSPYRRAVHTLRQKLPSSSGKWVPYAISDKKVSWLCVIEDQPASGIFKEPLGKILNWPLTNSMRKHCWHSSEQYLPPRHLAQQFIHYIAIMNPWKTIELWETFLRVTIAICFLVPSIANPVPTMVEFAIFLAWYYLICFYSINVL